MGRTGAAVLKVLRNANPSVGVLISEFIEREELSRRGDRNGSASPAFEPIDNVIGQRAEDANR
jgi:hypothetical protein